MLFLILVFIIYIIWYVIWCFFVFLVMVLGGLFYDWMKLKLNWEDKFNWFIWVCFRFLRSCGFNIYGKFVFDFFV